MKPIAHGAIMFCVLSLNAIAQTESGTIVALNSSQNEIVVSADSRTELESRYFDNRCKITALGNKLIFAASGHTGYGTANSTTGGVINMQWDTHVIARKEFIRLAEKQTVHNFPLKLAQAWGTRVKQQVEVELRFDAENVLSTLEGNVLTSAIFAGFEDDRLFIVTARITCGGKDKSEVRFLITDINHDPRAIFLGKDEIMQEFVAAQTERARAWNREAETQARVAGDQIAFYSIRFVQLSIQYDLGTILNGNTVHDLGGPIDVVRLRQGKGIDWIQRKPNCPAD